MAKISIVSFWAPPALGAAPYRVGNFTKFFVSKGHEVTLITAQQDAVSNSKHHLEVVNFKNLGLLKRKIFSSSPDLIILSVPPAIGISAVKAAHDKGIPLIYDIRDPLLYTHKAKYGNLIKEKMLEYYERALLTGAKAAVINSPGIREVYRDMGVERLFYFLPNGYDAVLFSHEREYTPKFLYFGAFNLMHSVINFKKFFSIYREDIEKEKAVFDFYCFPSEQLREVQRVSTEEKFNFIRFLPPITEEKFKNKLKEYSAGLTFVKTIYNYSIPSKFYTYLAMGIPTINVSFGRSIISRETRKYGVGYDINPEEYSPGLFDNIRKNYCEHISNVMKNRKVFYWPDLINEFYETQLKWLDEGN